MGDRIAKKNNRVDGSFCSLEGIAGDVPPSGKPVLRLRGSPSREASPPEGLLQALWLPRPASTLPQRPQHKVVYTAHLKVPKNTAIAGIQGRDRRESAVHGEREPGREPRGLCCGVSSGWPGPGRNPARASLRHTQLQGPGSDGGGLLQQTAVTYSETRGC